MKTESQKSNIDKLILFFALDSLTHIISGILSEINLTKKKYILLTLLILSFIFSFVSIFTKHSFYVFLNISIILFNIGLNFISVWCLEILPTKIRDFGGGMFFGFYRIGAISSQFIFIPIAKKSIILTLSFYSFLILFLIVLIFFLPNNQVKELDSELDLEENYSEKDEENSKNK